MITYEKIGIHYTPIPKKNTFYFHNTFTVLLSPVHVRVLPCSFLRCLLPPPISHPVVTKALPNGQTPPFGQDASRGTIYLLHFPGSSCSPD